MVAGRTAIAHADQNGVRIITGMVGAPKGAVGDGGPWNTARFEGIQAIASDRSGSLFVADQIGEGDKKFRIRFLNRSPTPVEFPGATGNSIVIAPGTMDTIPVALGVNSRNEVSGTATALHVDRDSLYVATAEAQSNASRKASLWIINIGFGDLEFGRKRIPAGRAERLAGGGIGTSANEAHGSAASPFFSAITTDPGGNVYFADYANSRISRINTDSVLSHFAGRRGPSSGSDNFERRPAQSASVNSPSGLASDSGGLIHFVDHGTDRLQYVDSGGAIRSILGSGMGASTGCRHRDAHISPSIDARPAAISIDKSDNVYFTAPPLAGIKKMAPSGLTSSIGSGTVAPPRPADQSLPISATIVQPAAITYAGRGFYILDAADSRIRFFNLSSRSVVANSVRVGAMRQAAIAGNGRQGFSGDGGPALEAALSGVQSSLAVAPNGSVFIADASSTTDAPRVRMVDISGRISTIVGPGKDYGAGRCCLAPTALAVHGSNGLFIADLTPPRVWYLNRGSASVIVNGQQIGPGESHPVAGSGKSGFGGDGGPAVMGELQGPKALALDGRGNLYIADYSDDNAIRRVDRNGILSTVAGTGGPGFNGDGLDTRLTHLNEPSGLAVDSCGNLLVTDRGNGRIRRIILTRSC